MTKTEQALEQLNKVQKKAIKWLVNGAAVPVDKRKGWFHTDARCRKDTAQVLCVNGLVQIDMLDSNFIVKPTALGTRVAKAL
jgi:hypothetical protein